MFDGEEFPEPRQGMAVATTAGALVFVATAIAGCTDEARGPEDVPTIEDVEERPERFEGQRVTLFGDVGRVYSDQAFELEGLAPVFDDSVLALSAAPVRLGPNRLHEDLLVSVRGEIRLLEPSAVGARLGRELDDQVTRDWKGETVILADTVTALEAHAHWNEKDLPEGQVVSLSALRVVPDPLAPAGAHVDLRGLRVAEKGASGLWVGEDAAIPELFVLPQQHETLQGLEPGEAVRVQGVLKHRPELDAASKRWQLDPASRARMAQKPLYVHALRITSTEIETPEPGAVAPPEG
jgi:hypothetical protein